MVGASIFLSQAPCPQVDSYVPLTYVLRSPVSQESQARCHMPLAATQVVPVTPSTWRWLRKRALGPSLGTWLAQLPQVQHDFHQFPYPGVSSVKLQAVPSFIGFHRYMVADDSEDCQPAFMKLDLKKQLLGWWGPQGGPWDPSCPEVWSCNDPGGGWGLGLKYLSHPGSRMHVFILRWNQTSAGSLRGGICVDGVVFFFGLSVIAIAGTDA